MSEKEQDDTFNSKGVKTWYIKRSRDGEISGRIQLQNNNDLEIVQASFPEPEEATEEQKRQKVSPRGVTIQAPKQTSLVTGNSEQPTHCNYVRSTWVQDIECSVFSLTREEFGEIIWCKQKGYVVCCKWINFYYKGGKEKGRYCTITNFTEQNQIYTIPNWKFFCIGFELQIIGNIEECEDFDTIGSRSNNLYRISKVEIPPHEECDEIVRRIKATQDIHDLV